MQLLDIGAEVDGVNILKSCALAIHAIENLVTFVGSNVQVAASSRRSRSSTILGLIRLHRPIQCCLDRSYNELHIIESWLASGSWLGSRKVSPVFFVSAHQIDSIARNMKNWGDLTVRWLHWWHYCADVEKMNWIDCGAQCWVAR